MTTWRRTLTTGILIVTLVMSSAAVASGAPSTGGSSLTQARKALLVLSDLPKGWTSVQSSSANNSAFPGESQLAACIGVSASVIQKNPPSVNSPTFSNGTLSADDEVEVFR